MGSRLEEGRAWQEGTTGSRKPTGGGGGCNAREEGLSFSRGEGGKRQRVVERGISELRVSKEMKSDVGG